MSRVLIVGNRLEVNRAIGDAIEAAGLPIDYSEGHADTLQRLRTQSFGVVLTSADSSLVEDLALLEEMRGIRPGVKCILLAGHSTPVEVIAALRARAFACFTPPFDTHEIASLACGAASESLWRDDIQVLSAKPGWVSVRVNCRLLTAERMMTFANELSAQLPVHIREDVMQALREVVLNAMEHGAAFNPEQVVEVTAVRTARAMVFHVRDPGAGFRRESVAQVAGIDGDPAATTHLAEREHEGIRAGGYGMLVAAGTVDELIYSEIGNEVLLIKYLDTAPADEFRM